MKKLIFLSFLLSFPVSAAQFEWIIPTTYTDGSPIKSIDYSELWCKTTSYNKNNVVTVPGVDTPPGSTAIYQVADWYALVPLDGDITCTLKVIVGGQVSANSNEVTFNMAGGTVTLPATLIPNAAVLSIK